MRWLKNLPTKEIDRSYKSGTPVLGIVYKYNCGSLALPSFQLIALYKKYINTNFASPVFYYYTWTSKKQRIFEPVILCAHVPVPIQNQRRERNAPYNDLPYHFCMYHYQLYPEQDPNGIDVAARNVFYGCYGMY